jgi:hypothetical protein
MNVTLGFATPIVGVGVAFQALGETGVELPSAERRLAMARYPESLICDPSWPR